MRVATANPGTSTSQQPRCAASARTCASSALTSGPARSASAGTTSMAKASACNAWAEYWPVHHHQSYHAWMDTIMIHRPTYADAAQTPTAHNARQRGHATNAVMGTCSTVAQLRACPAG